MHDIRISAVMNGYVCKVGCQTLVFGGRDSLIRELDSYLRDPEGTENRYLAKHPMQHADYPANPAPEPTPNYATGQVGQIYNERLNQVINNGQNTGTAGSLR